MKPSGFMESRAAGIRFHHEAYAAKVIEMESRRGRAELWGMVGEGGAEK